MQHIFVGQAKGEEPECFFLVGDKQPDVVLVGVHLVFVVLGRLGIGYDIEVEGLDIGERQQVSLDVVADVGALHEILGRNLVGLVEVIMGENSQTRDFVDPMLVLVVLEELEHILVDDGFREILEQLEVRVVGVAEPSVDEARVEHGPHLVEKVLGLLRKNYGLLPCGLQILHAQARRLVEVQDPQVIVAAE